MRPAMLIDLTMCVGCEACVTACKEINELPRDVDSSELSAYTWSIVERKNGLSIRRQCMHCEDPACVSVCPVAALQKSPEGPVIYNSDRCMGCRYCVLGCPFSVPRYQWDSPVPLVQKCIFCYDKLVSKGRPPACATACPTGATKYGDRARLIAEAQSRIKSNPDNYVDAIFGLEEAGGTAVMYISPIPFEKLGFNTGVRKSSYPGLTHNIMEKLPGVVGVMGVLMTGIWWITNRREKVAEEEGEGKKVNVGSEKKIEPDQKRSR